MDTNKNTTDGLQRLDAELAKGNIGAETHAAGVRYLDASDRTVTVNKPRKTTDDEWRVTVTVNGRHAPERDYFGTDRQDAIDTREAMIQEAREAGENVTNNTNAN